MPGSLSFLALCVFAGLVLMFVWPRNKRVGRRWLMTVFGGYLLLALPVVANAIAGRLPVVPVADGESLGGLNTLIVLDGDNPLGRIKQAGRVYARALPQQLWVAGEPSFGHAIVEAGVPGNLVSDLSQEQTTRGQLARMKMLATRNDPGRTGLIASRLHMPRVAALVQAAGLNVTLIPSPVDVEPPVSGVGRFLPSFAALQVSRDALYEHVALAYYRWRRWI